MSKMSSRSDEEEEEEALSKMSFYCFVFHFDEVFRREKEEEVFHNIQEIGSFSRPFR